MNLHRLDSKIGHMEDCNFIIRIVLYRLLLTRKKRNSRDVTSHIFAQATHVALYTHQVVMWGGLGPGRRLVTHAKFYENRFWVLVP